MMNQLDSFACLSKLTTETLRYCRENAGKKSLIWLQPRSNIEKPIVQ